MSRSQYSRRQYVCPNCGSVGRPRLYNGPFRLSEIVLWLVFTVPGLAGFVILILTFFGFIKSVGAAAIPAGNEGANEGAAVGAGLAIGGGMLLYVYFATACLIYALPGFLYSLARMTTKYSGCPYCEAPNMMPVDTPRGRQLLRQVD
jgi:hypothetical protein